MEINNQIESELNGQPLVNHTWSVQQKNQISMQDPSHHAKSTDSCSNYFEKKLNDRKKRTFNILKRFNPALASEVIYKVISSIMYETTYP